MYLDLYSNMRIWYQAKLGSYTRTSKVKQKSFIFCRSPSSVSNLLIVKPEKKYSRCSHSRDFIRDCNNLIPLSQIRLFSKLAARIDALVTFLNRSRSPRKRGPPEIWRFEVSVGAELDFAKLALATRLTKSACIDRA